MASETKTDGSSSGATLLTAAAIGGALLGAGLVYFSLSAGDEPPIWVKNGSMEIELLHNSKEWRENGNKANWKVSGGTRGKSTYQVLISPSNAANCSGDLKPATETVTFVYSDAASTTVEFKATGNHTHIKVTPAQDLTQSSDKRTLSLDAGGGGYIAKIQAGQTSCTFTEKDPNLAVALLDR